MPLVTVKEAASNSCVSYEKPSFPFESPSPLPASPTLRRFTVVPRLPVALERLRELAHNLFWVWTPVARELFVRIDPTLFEKIDGNPIELLSRVKQARLDELAEDDAFLSHLDTAHAALRTYLSSKGWFQRTYPEASSARIAYFSMEYGLHEALPIYSGGLGVLAGDHLKTASDLGLPLVGVGLAYAEGYFRQTLNEDGWQGERYPRNDWHKLPVLAVDGQDGKRLVIDVQYPDRIVHAQLWRVQVGRVPLYLLDTNIEQNAASDRAITGPLYGGDKELRDPPGDHARHRRRARARGRRALADGLSHERGALGVPRARAYRSGDARPRRDVRGRERGDAPRATSSRRTRLCPQATTCSTASSFGRYLEPYRAALGISDEQLLDLGRARPSDPHAPFSMPILAIRTADRYNGVSAAARARLAQDVEGALARSPRARGPDPLGDERRAHPVVDQRRDECALHALPRATLGGVDGRRRALGPRRTRSPTPSSGKCTSTAVIASLRAHAARSVATRSSTHARSRSASRAASRRTSVPTSSSPTSSG